VTQAQQVIAKMKELGGFATFGQLNAAMDYSRWKSKTPEASVRRIVQDNPAFFKIKPGLWALEEQKPEVLSKLNIATVADAQKEDFSHSYYQGLAVEVGNYKDQSTYVPNQDKNRLFVGKPLSSVSSLNDIEPFAYPELLRYAKTVDVVWFNERRMPSAFIEIEHSTDILNSLTKFYELQDFNASFQIVADEYRESKFHDVINRTIFDDIRQRVEFVSYEKLASIHALSSQLALTNKA